MLHVVSAVSKRCPRALLGTFCAAYPTHFTVQHTVISCVFRFQSTVAVSVNDSKVTLDSIGLCTFSLLVL